MMNALQQWCNERDAFENLKEVHQCFKIKNGQSRIIWITTLINSEGVSIPTTSIDKKAIRAYAQVICKVVGWDIDQMPAIVLKDLDSSLAGSRKLFVRNPN